MYVQCNIEARSPVIIALEKAINITYLCVCMRALSCGWGGGGVRVRERVHFRPCV